MDFSLSDQETAFAREAQSAAVGHFTSPPDATSASESGAGRPQ